MFHVKHFLAAVALFLSAGLALANQSNTWSPTTGTVSGLQLTQNYNNGFTAIQTCNSGAVAPTNDQSGLSVQGQCWLNTGTTPFTVEMFDGTAWTTRGWLDTANHQWIANNSGGTGTIVSATTTDLGTVVNPVMSVTGTTTITSFGSSALTGETKFLNFTGVLVLTNNATSLILPNGGSNITTAAGDTAIATYLGSGNWRVISYTRASGLGAGSVTASFLANSAIPYGTPCLNCTISASVAGNALTLTIQTLAGATPSSIDPVTFLIPNGTGGWTALQLTASLSITVPSGASLGTINGQANRVWLAVFNNSGTPVLGVYVSWDGAKILCWDETGTNAGTAITGSSTAAQTWYTASSLGGASNFRVIGFVEAKQTTAGLWASSPTKTMLFGPGVKKPNDPVTTVTLAISSSDTSASTTFIALTNNRITIPLQSAANVVQVMAGGNITNAGNNLPVVQLSRGVSAATNLFGNQGSNQTAGTGGNNVLTPSFLIGYDTPNTTGNQIYAVQGKMSSNTMTYGGNTYMSAVELQI